MCEFLNAIFLLNFENFEKILFDQSVILKMEWEKPPRSLILENDVFVDTLMYIHMTFVVVVPCTVSHRRHLYMYYMIHNYIIPICILTI